jgi:superfamily II DNA or RNA helicase
MQKRPYQQKLKLDVYDAWARGARCVVMVLATGGGKTVVLGEIHQEHAAPSCLIAHRQELVGQLSMNLAGQGIRHNLIAAQDTRRAIAAAHVEEFGASFFNPHAATAVASVDTLVLAKDLGGWAAQVTLVTTDEGHHVVQDNKWHKALKLFTNPACRFLLPTATPERADGQGLGLPPIGSGVADAMVQGPPMRWLIEEGYLTDYDVVCPLSDLAAANIPVSASGDYSPRALTKAAHASHIVGDVVTEYLKYAPGKRGVTFTTDVETAQEITAAYRLMGVRAETLTGTTRDGIRRQIIRQFKAGGVDVIVAVDIISEGFDIPAIQVLSGARPSQSFPLFSQQFGRLLRPMYAPGYDLDTRVGRLAAIAAGPKPKGLYIDHVGNYVKPQLGAPDKPRVWSLANREKRSVKPSPEALVICLSHTRPGPDGTTKTGCFRPYERVYPACPHCGLEPEIKESAGRGSPAAVDGDLMLLDPDTLALLRGQVADANRTLGEYNAWLATRRLPGIAQAARVKGHGSALEARGELRDIMAQWGGGRAAAGDDDRTAQRRFYLTFGVDVLTAQTLNQREAEALSDRIRETF